MYRRIEDFIIDWQKEEESTLKIFLKINENTKSKKLHKDVRSLERLAWHITQTLTEMPTKAGLFLEDELEDKPIPDAIVDLIEIYKNQSIELINSLRTNWTDEQLSDSIEIYGQQWKKVDVLSVLLKHQIHHRAQMTVLMRMQNIEVPGLYGPSKEEWISYGMKPQD